MSVTERLYRLLARLYPGDIREYTDEMWAVIERRRGLVASEGKRWLGLRVWAFIARDLVRTLPTTHIAALSRKARARAVGSHRGGKITRETRRMAGLWNDARFALRGLFRSPGFTVIAIGTLALGIGAVSAIFTVVNGVLLKPPPFEDAERLVGVWHTAPGAGVEDMTLSSAMFLTYRDENRVFEDIGARNSGQVSVTGLEEPEQLSAMRVTAGLLPLLRVQPVIGRRFTE